MRIADTSRKTVAFLGVRVNGQFSPRATAFFVNYTQEQHQFSHLVTAEHVVSGLLSQGHDIVLRVNLQNGEIAEIAVDHREFRFHPNAENEPTDVAVCPISTVVTDDRTGQEMRMDVRTMPLNGEGSHIASPEWMTKNIGLGSDIAILGLFRSHYGKSRNVPIVRVGNISSMPEEPVFTKYCGYIKAYLVEARSIAGLSGSPVFAIPDLAPMAVNAILDIIQHRTPARDKQGVALLGLMHGHFDVRNLNEDVVQDGGPEGSVHTGIGVVVPVEKIIETIEHPELVEMRRSFAEKLRAKGEEKDAGREREAE